MRPPFAIQKVFINLCRRLGRVGSVATSIVRDAKTAETTAQEGEWVRGGLFASVHTTTVGEGGVVLACGESSLSTAVKSTRGHASVVAVSRAHGGVRGGTSTKSGRKSVG